MPDGAISPIEAHREAREMRKRSRREVERSRRQLVEAVEWQLDLYHQDTIKDAVSRLPGPVLEHLEQHFRLAHGRRLRRAERGEGIFR
jgi:hypothetical protein